MARFLYSKQCLGLNLSVTIDGRGGCTLFRVLQEIKHWHARLVFGTHTHIHLGTSCHILPHLALLFGLESSASGTALDCGCHPRGIGHQESGVWSLCYSLSMSQYISVLLCPIHLLSLSISFYPCSRKNIMFYLVFLPVPSHMPA